MAPRRAGSGYVYLAEMSDMAPRLVVQPGWTFIKTGCTKDGWFAGTRGNSRYGNLQQANPRLRLVAERLFENMRAAEGRIKEILAHDYLRYIEPDDELSECAITPTYNRDMIAAYLRGELDLS